MKRLCPENETNSKMYVWMTMLGVLFASAPSVYAQTGLYVVRDPEKGGVAIETDADAVTIAGAAYIHGATSVYFDYAGDSSMDPSYGFLDSATLGPMIETLHASGLEVEALIYDDLFVEDIVDYNSAVGSSETFDAIRLRYLGPWPSGYATPSKIKDIEIYEDAVALAGDLPLRATIDYEWSTRIKIGNIRKPAYQHIIDITDSVDVLNWTESASTLVSLTRHEVCYAASTGKIATPTIETSDLVSLKGLAETQTFFEEGRDVMNSTLASVSYVGQCQDGVVVDDVSYSFHFFDQAIASSYVGWGCDAESCDGFDNDCDGVADEEGSVASYVDDDGDGIGSGPLVYACGGTGYSLLDGDCNDASASAFPGATEVSDGIDNDCDGLVDEAGSLRFDGTDDYLYIGDDPVLDITGPMTLEAWVYSEDPNRDAPVLAKENSGGRQQYWFGVYYNHFGLLLGNGSDWGLNARASGNISANTWTHIASVWDGSAWYNYQDGVLVGSGTYTGTLPTSDQPLTIAINSGYDNTRYKGLLYDVRLWNVARTQLQIQAAKCSLETTTGLVGRWRLDDGSGQSAANSASSSYQARLGSSSSTDSRDPSWNAAAPQVLTDWFADQDGDAFGNDADLISSCESPTSYVSAGGDCNDLNSSIYPGSLEVDDFLDNDCDGLVDEDGSLFFDGSDDFLNIGDNSTLDISGAITMEAWVNATDANRDAPILAKENSGGRQQYWFGVYYNDFGLLLGNGSDWGLVARSSGTITANTWTHLASVWDGARWYNYQDGVLVGTGTYSGTLPSSDQSLTIGINSGYDNTRYKGYLADVRLWNVARTQDQIVQGMCSLNDTAGLVGWWLMDEGAGQSASDQSSYAHDARLGTSTSADSRDPGWSTPTPATSFTWYQDLDDDGFGDSTNSVNSCEYPGMHVLSAGDCLDSDDTVYTDAPEFPDGVDNDCDGQIDEATSLRFDGSDDAIYVGSQSSLDVHGPITMEAWVNPDNSNRDAPILAKEGSSGTQQFWFGVYNTKFGLLLGNGSGWGLDARASGSIGNGTWVHIASVWNGSSWSNYQNGSLVGSGTYTGTVPSTSNILTIGINSSFDSTRYQGYLSDVRLWNVARSQSQIQNESCVITTATGLVGRWLMGEGHGQTAYDNSGVSNHGALGSNSSSTDSRDPTWSATSLTCSAH